jgi:hypothetical protein
MKSTKTILLIAALVLALGAPVGSEASPWALHRSAGHAASGHTHFAANRGIARRAAGGVLHGWHIQPDIAFAVAAPLPGPARIGLVPCEANSSVHTFCPHPRSARAPPAA